MGSIPIIDLAPLRDGRPEKGLSLVSEEIRKAASEVGFFYLINHGVSPDLQVAAREAAVTFFGLPDERKAQIAVDQFNRGFMAAGDCKLPGAKATDLKEVFFWGPELSVDDPAVLKGNPLMAPNQWPEGLPDFRDSILAYYRAVMACGQEVLQAIAVSLNLPADFFSRFYRSPLGRGQLVYYPRQPDDAPGEVFGAAPHSDFGALTLLLQDDCGGLEIQTLQGEWVAATPLPNSLVVNIGDLLARWSNNRLRSTVHRVINRVTDRRISIPVFCDPDSRAVIDPRDMGLPPDQEALFEAVEAGAYIMGRNRISFAHYTRTGS